VVLAVEALPVAVPTVAVFIGGVRVTGVPAGEAFPDWPPLVSGVRAIGAPPVDVPAVDVPAVETFAGGVLPTGALPPGMFAAGVPAARVSATGG
jgi:hypothetical protein